MKERDENRLWALVQGRSKAQESGNDLIFADLTINLDSSTLNIIMDLKVFYFAR